MDVHNRYVYVFNIYTQGATGDNDTGLGDISERWFIPARIITPSLYLLGMCWLYTSNNQYPEEFDLHIAIRFHNNHTHYQKQGE